MREGRSVDVRKREKKHGNHCVCGTVLDRVSGKIKMVAMVAGEKSLKFEIGLLLHQDLQHMSFGIMEPKICIELALKEW